MAWWCRVMQEFESVAVPQLARWAASAAAPQGICERPSAVRAAAVQADRDLEVVMSLLGAIWS